MTVGVDGEEHPGTAASRRVRSRRPRAGGPHPAGSRRGRRGPGPGPGRRGAVVPGLGDADTWTPLADAAALFAAGALVTGDGAIALHVGEELLWVGRRPAVPRTSPALGSPEVAVRHIGAMDRTVRRGDRGRRPRGRTRPRPGPGGAVGRPPRPPVRADPGPAVRVPACSSGAPARVTEHECAARGGRACRYCSRGTCRRESPDGPAPPRTAGDP